MWYTDTTYLHWLYLFFHLRYLYFLQNLYILSIFNTYSHVGHLWHAQTQSSRIIFDMLIFIRPAIIVVADRLPHASRRRGIL